MQITTSLAASGLTVRLSGPLTLVDHRAFRALIQDINRSGAAEVTFDCTGLAAIDSAGVGMMVIALEAAETHGWRLRLSGVCPSTHRVLRLAPLDAFIEAGAT